MCVFSQLEILRNGGSSRENYVLTNKAPVFDRGTYRLNFHVSQPHNLERILSLITVLAKQTE